MPRFRRALPLLLAGLLAAAPLAAQFPTGFHEQDLCPPGTFTFPMAIDFAPDGSVFVIERLSGAVSVRHPTGLVTLFTLPGVVAGAQTGGLGLAVDPAWPTRPFLYAFHTRLDAQGSPVNEVVRVQMSGVSTRPPAEWEAIAFNRIYGGIPAASDHHTAGCLRFGADGALYLSTGDSGVPITAQDLTSPHGKILRFAVAHLPAAPDGAVFPVSAVTPGDNPFLTGHPVTDLVYCYGLRNPFRFDVDPVTGVLVIADVGQSSWEELDLAQGGENFGWPWFEGPAVFMTGPGSPPAGLTPPILALPHGTAAGITTLFVAGGIYRSTGAPFDFGPAYDGQLFFGDIGFLDAIARLAFDGVQWAFAPAVAGQSDPFVWGLASFCVEARFAPDGALYHLAYFDGALRRVLPTAAARELVAIAGDGQAGNAGTAVFSPLEVELRDAAGLPVPNETIHVTVTGGRGVSPKILRSDAAGRALVPHVLAPEYRGEPRVAIHHPGAAAPATFDLAWRGIATRRDRPPFISRYLTVRHETPGLPFALVLDHPAPTPFVQLQAGALWTGVLGATTTWFGVGDGNGVHGPFRADFFTATGGVVEVPFQLPIGLPAGDWTMQVYALDPLLAYPASLFVSNPLTISHP